jgi:hypothetical protein
VDEEIDKLGGVPANAKRDSTDFEAAKREVMSLPVVKVAVVSAVAPVPTPSGTFVDYQGSDYTLKVPDNWKKYEEKGSVAFVPEGGASQSGQLAYGLIVLVSDGRVDGNDSKALEKATQQLIQELAKNNRELKVSREPEAVRLNDEPGLSTYLRNDSPAGGTEVDWLITVMRPEGLLSFLCVAPKAAFAEYEKTFTAVLDSVRLGKQ